MNHPLEIKVNALRGRLRRLAAVFGAGRMVSTVLAAIVVAALADYLIRFEDPGLRVLSALSVWGVFVAAAYRYLWRTARVRWTDVELARHVQRNHPALGDVLASAVEFLKQRQDDPMAGSVAMRRAVITRATVAVEPLDFRSVASRRSARRSLVGAGAVAACAAALTAMSPASARVALARLIQPLGDVAWPQENNLEIRRVSDRIARGGAFDVEVVDVQGASLPSDARIVFRFENADGEPAQEVERMRIVGATLVARRQNVVRPFAFRIEGGDYRPPSWHAVEVVAPPAVEELRLTLLPPAYTGWPPEPSEGNVRALVGTRVDVRGRTSTPVQSVVLCLRGGAEIPARLEPDGRAFAVGVDAPGAFVVEKSGSYAFRLTDREGLVGGESVQWEVRAVEDAPPTASIEHPRDNVFVTPRAAIPLRIVAQDDLALKTIDVSWEFATQPGQVAGTLPLVGGPATVAPAAAEASRRGAPDRRETRAEWRLETLDLKPGVQLTFRASASDYRPQRGASAPQRLTVVTPEELAERLAVRLTGIVEELTRVLAIQRTARGNAGDVAARVGESGRLDQTQLDRLRGAELSQRQVAEALAGRSEGVAVHVAGLLADIEVNRLDQRELARRLESLRDQIDRLEREPLAAIARDLTFAVKSAQATADAAAGDGAAAKGSASKEVPAGKPHATDPAMAAALRRAVGGQDTVVETIERLLAEFGRADGFRRFQSDLLQILRDQEQLARRTGALAAKTLTKELKELSPQEAADLRGASDVQSQLARQLDRAMQLMDQSLAALRESDAATAQTVADAMARAAQFGLGGQMRAAGLSIQQNRIGRAGALQQQVVKQLQEVLDLLSNRREHEVARLVKRLRDVEKSVAELAAKQDAVRAAESQAAATADPKQQKDALGAAAAEQKRLQEELQRLVGRLEPPASGDVAASMQDAAGAMERSRREAQQGRAETAARAAQEATAKLEEARRRLAEKHRQAEAELAVEQLARLQDALQGIVRRQQRALDETKRLAEFRASGAWTPGQQAGLRDLVAEQRLLQTETTAVADQVAGAEVLHVALHMATESMSEASNLLERQETGAATQSAQQTAATRLAQVVESLKPEPPPPQEAKTDPGRGGAGGGNGAGRGGPRMPGDRVPDLAQIKLLKLLQEEVRVQTEALSARPPGNPAVDELAGRRYEALGRRQAKLADLLLDLLRVTPTSHSEAEPEDNSDQAPHSHEPVVPGGSP